MRWLKQSTTVTLKIGPFVDRTDGYTAETALTPTVQVAKNGSAFAARNSATAIAHDADGFYNVELNTTDTNTLGVLVVKSFVVTDALPVWHEFMIVPANVWDSLFGASQLQVDATAIATAVLDAEVTEPAAVWTWPVTLRKLLGWLGALSRNKVTQTATTQTLRNDADSATIATSAHTDDGTTHVRGEFT